MYAYKSSQIYILTMSICHTGGKQWGFSVGYARRQINDVNSKMLYRFTSTSIAEEARPLTCNYDLVKNIRLK